MSNVPITVVSIYDGVILAGVAGDEDESGFRSCSGRRNSCVIPIIACPAGEGEK